jgi:hypothetical protein
MSGQSYPTSILVCANGYTITTVIVKLLSNQYSTDHFKYKSNAYYKSVEDVSTDTSIIDLERK